MESMNSFQIQINPFLSTPGIKKITLVRFLFSHKAFQAVMEVDW